MTIREYIPADLPLWLRCRATAYLDTGAFAEIKAEKESYLQPGLSLVAEDGGHVIGLIDLEPDSYDLALAGEDRGAVIWDLAVLPEYRRRGVATALWEEAKGRLAKRGISYCEAWTGQCAPANGFFLAAGFVRQEAQTWLRCRANAAGVEMLIPQETMDGLFGIDELVFNAPLTRREELTPLCDNIEEARLYSIRF